jgi:oligopeptide/dipeptide ABC transporter ATP-binding protein
VSASTALLEINDLSVGLHARNIGYDIVRNVSLAVNRNEILAVVGESGCGKSLTALSILQLQASPPLFITGGSILYDGRDLVKLSKSEMRKVRGPEIAMIFQDPMSALDPMFTVGTLLTSAVLAHRSVGKDAAEKLALEALADAGIEDPKRRFDEYPFQLSGGVSQRAMIALALVNDPKLIIADEPTTALDVTVQAQILDRLKELKKDRGMSILLITHNLGVVASVADRMAVMYTGEVVETGAVTDVFERPQHPYTNGLLGAVPRLGGQASDLTPIVGRVPQPDELPVGCTFVDRCSRAVAQCSTTRPILHARGRVEVRCHNPVG